MSLVGENKDDLYEKNSDPGDRNNNARAYRQTESHQNFPIFPRARTLSTTTTVGTKRERKKGALARSRS